MIPTRRRLLTGGLAGAGAVALSGCGARTAPDGTRLLHAADVHPADYPTVTAVKWMGEELGRLTDGRLGIRSFPSGQLGNEDDSIGLARYQAIDICRVAAAALNYFGKSVHELNAQEAAYLALQFAERRRFGLPEQDRRFRRQALPALHDGEQRVRQVIEMQERLTCVEVARIEMAHQLAFVDAGDLVGQESRVAHVVVDARRTRQDHRNRASLLPDQLHRTNLRRAVGKLRVKRPVFVDGHALPAGRMDKHRAGKHELFQLEGLEATKEPFGAAHGHLLVFWVRLAREVEVGGELNH